MKSRAVSLTYRVLGVTGLISVAGLWLLTAMAKSPVLVSIKDALAAAFLVLVVLILLVGIGWGLFASGQLLDRLIGFGMILILIALSFWVQRHTDMGVLVLGGASYWVERAAEAPDAEARTYLSLVLRSTQYGVNRAERAVLALPSAEGKKRLFLLLAEQAPTEHWQKRFRSRAEDAGAS